VRPPGRARAGGPAALLVILTLLAAAPDAFAWSEKIRGVVEEVRRGGIVLDSTFVVLDEDGRVKGDVDSLDRIKVGYWAEARGRWRERGDLKADKIKVKRDVPGHTFFDGLEAKSRSESRKLNESDKIYGDPAVSEYVRDVGTGLVPEFARSDFSFSFQVLEDPSLNAFAFPNGAIYVHTGLLAKMENEAQLATVLGHEISHVTQRHGQRQYKKMVAVVIPAQIGAIILGTEIQRRTDNPIYETMAILGLNLGLAAAVNGYGRTLEDQADRVGLRYTADSGYDHAESPKVWVIFNDFYGDESKVENFFYSNHSTNEIRKENLETEIERHYREREKAPRAAGKLPDVERPAPIVRGDHYQKTMLGLTRDNAVADFELKRYRLAEAGFDRVLKHRPADPVAHHYKGRIIVATKEGVEARERALASYLKALSVAPEYAEAHRDLGLLYAEIGRRADARGHLERYLDLAPSEAPDRKKIRKALEKIGGS
jgi:predicted Zn-dependent protease